VYLASNDYCKQGNFESEVLDARFPALWGNISWEMEAPEGTRIGFSTRTGNSKKPDNTWSPWSDENFEEEKIQSPSSRFIQYRASFSTTDPLKTPLLGRVSIAYMSQNQAPDILSLSVSQRERFPRVSPPTRGEAAEEAPRAPLAVTRVGGGGRETKNISWKATDPNGDSMSYQLFYKGLKEKEWKPLAKEEIKGESFSWQTTRVPDGEYLVKLVVSDEPDNPRGIALSAEKVSETFLIDNTRPRFITLKGTVSQDGKKVEVSGLASDESSIISKLEYSVDAGDWTTIFPADNIFDSRQEDFQFIVEGLAPGEHTIVINATDAEGNIESGKVVLELGK
jgi:hypothetical protein